MDSIRQQTVVAQVMARIKELIASGEYRPGSRLPTEHDLAQQFGVGRSSVREALKVFQHLGVVESRTAKGTFVRDRSQISAEAITWALLLGEDDLRDVFELRVVIERSGFRKLARRYAEGLGEACEAVEAMKREVERMEAAAPENDYEELCEADYRFHEAVIAAGGNQLFLSIYHTLHAFMREEILQSYRQVEEPAQVASDHRDILEVLLNQPREAAEHRHSAHFGRIESLLAIQPERSRDV